MRGKPLIMFSLLEADVEKNRKPYFVMFLMYFSSISGYISILSDKQDADYFRMASSGQDGIIKIWLISSSDSTGILNLKMLIL